MPATSIVVIGRNGQLARELADLAWPAGTQTSFLGRNEIDLFDAEETAWKITALRPAIIINTAAYTAVDLAESDVRAAAMLNCEIPARLATLAGRLDIPLLHFSTDYVFAGDADAPYREGDPTAPASIYGQSKLAGEEALLASDARAVIIRSAGLFGRHGQNFLKGMLARSFNPQPVSMVADQISTPTPADSLAVMAQQMALDLIAGRELPRLLHLTSQSAVTWYDFTRAIFDHLRAAGRVSLPPLEKLALADLARPAPRPRYSPLDCNRAASLGYATLDWPVALAALVPALVKERIAA